RTGFSAGSSSILTELAGLKTLQMDYETGHKLLSEAEYYSKHAAIFDPRYGKQVRIRWYLEMSAYYYILGAYQKSVAYSLRGVQTLEENEVDDPNLQINLYLN